MHRDSCIRTIDIAASYDDAQTPPFDTDNGRGLGASSSIAYGRKDLGVKKLRSGPHRTLPKNPLLPGSQVSDSWSSEFPVWMPTKRWFWAGADTSGESRKRGKGVQFIAAERQVLLSNRIHVLLTFPSYLRRSSSSTTFPYSEMALPSSSSVSARTGNRGFSARAHMFSPAGVPSSRSKCQPKFVRIKAVS
jgi:hypothetical protein